jgi:hypothetical protein
VITQTAAERFDKRGLSRPHRPTDTNHRNMTRPRRRYMPVATMMFIRSMHNKKRAYSNS